MKVTCTCLNEHAMLCAELKVGGGLFKAPHITTRTACSCACHLPPLRYHVFPVEGRFQIYDGDEQTYVGKVYRDRYSADINCRSYNNLDLQERGIAPEVIQVCLYGPNANAAAERVKTGKRRQ